MDSLSTMLETLLKHLVTSIVGDYIHEHPKLLLDVNSLCVTLNPLF
jgi:hypothetical protein